MLSSTKSLTVHVGSPRPALTGLVWCVGLNNAARDDLNAAFVIRSPCSISLSV